MEKCWGDLTPQMSEGVKNEWSKDDTTRPPFPLRRGALRLTVLLFSGHLSHHSRLTALWATPSRAWKHCTDSWSEAPLAFSYHSLIHNQDGGILLSVSHPSTAQRLHGSINTHGQANNSEVHHFLFRLTVTENRPLKLHESTNILYHFLL